jgi:uncharacterized protein DUF1707
MTSGSHPDDRAPRRAGSSPGLVRVGDRERADAADRLTAHAAAGRLSIDELEQRLEHVHSAVYARDLDAVEADLPARRREPPRRPPLAAIALVCLVAAVLATALVGHPIAPLFLAGALLWRTGRWNRRNPLSLQRSFP